MIKSDEEFDNRGQKITFLGAILFTLVGAYLIFLFSLQVINGSEYKNRATLVSQRTTTIQAKRGEIFDRNADLPLVLNVDSFAISLNPALVPKELLPGVFQKLSAALGIEYAEIEKKVPTSVYSVYQAIEIRSGISLEVVSYIAERIQDFPGVTWESKPIRSYVETGSISHVLGYVGNITQDELQVLYNQGYSLKSILGKSGLEKQYDLFLRGKDGTRFRTVDVKGRNVDSDVRMEIPPELGKDLVLTIDQKIQKLAEKALGPRMGSVVILKPATGEILALVSYPFFDPNKFYTSEANKEFNRLTTDPQYPFLNRAIQSTYPPASTFKIIMSAAILGEKVYDPMTYLLCTGKFELGDRTFKDHVQYGHGPVNLAAALAESCNIYYYTMGQKYLGVDRITEYARKFGLGQATGIDLPNEVEGLVPTPKWKERNLNYPWLGGDTVNISIGQGYLAVTPIQMANVVSMVVNDGKVYRPHLIKEIRNPVTGQAEEEIRPELLYDVQFNDKVLSELRDDMRGVIVHGTAKEVMLQRAVKIAGKTGTGEDGAKGSSNHSWFVAYGPYDDVPNQDKIVVVVQVEKGNEWEWWAPKAADLIFQGVFANQTYEEVVESLHPWYLKDQ